MNSVEEDKMTRAVRSLLRRLSYCSSRDTE
jgi:hypothetical protein